MTEMSLVLVADMVAEMRLQVLVAEMRLISYVAEMRLVLGLQIERVIMEAKSTQTKTNVEYDISKVQQLLSIDYE